jgi:tetratricopeptide (TPR) repeat protein
VTREDAEQITRNLRLNDADAVFKIGLGLIKADRPEQIMEAAKAAALLHPAHAKIHQLLGLAARSTGHSRLALKSFQRAAALAPTDALIAHGHARTALEAGQPAVRLFDEAVRLSPRDASVRLGRTAALLDEGVVASALDYLTELVERNPLWMEGHRTLARLRGQQGLDPAEVTQRILAQQSGNSNLHREYIAIYLEARNLTEADVAVLTAMRLFGKPSWLVELAAHVASEMGARDRADLLFSQLGAPTDIDQVAQRSRHLIRAGRAESAESLISQWVDQDADRILWPYRSLAWRMAGDERWDWLEDGASQIQVYDLADQIGDLDALAVSLRRLHSAREAPLDQSVRGGTQTDGHLLLRDEPLIQNLKTCLTDTVASFISQLPPPIEGHPFLISTRDPIRITGSWSVRLQGAGFHADHVHSQGWISSAFYVGVPDQTSGNAGAKNHEGWLSLGESRELVPSLDPIRLIEPRPGRLVLFPSTMWHGTRPFPAGERLTVAFDIARPQQG